MPRPTKDNEIEDLEELREIAERDPLKALEEFVGKVVKDQPPTNKPVDFLEQT